MTNDASRGKGMTGQGVTGKGGRSLGAVLTKVTAPVLRRHASPAARLMLDWEEIVGPALARLSAPRRLAAGTVTIACAGPVGMELQHRAPQLIERINAYFGPVRREFPDKTRVPALPVLHLKIVQDPALAADMSVTARRAAPPVPVPGLGEGPLRDVLERMGGQIRARRSERDGRNVTF